MSIVYALAGAALVLLVLWEGFETIILPRRVTRPFRVTGLFYRWTWGAWTGIASRLFAGRRLESVLGYFGPLSLLSLLILWASGLLAGFALLHWGVSDQGQATFWSALYLSGTTFFTLGLGDVVPVTPAGRFLTALEAGTGFGFLALMIAYLPGLNQSFSRREVSISLLDARAGSPPTAAEMLLRHADGQLSALEHLLHEWEGWAAEFLEGQLSYPVLAYFRSQHENQSWLAALTAVLDASALVMTGLDGGCARQARLTFAMARHVLVDLALLFRVRPGEQEGRLDPAVLSDLRSRLASSGLRLRPGGEAELQALRRKYEPYLLPLATYFRMPIPPFVPRPGSRDNWEVSAWESDRAGPLPVEAAPVTASSPPAQGRS